MSVPRERRDVGDEQIPTFRSHIHGIARAEMKATRPTICYRTTIYKNQHRHEPPLFHLGFIQEAEAFSSGRQRQRSGIERDRPRRSRRATTCSSISWTSARSVIRRYAKKKFNCWRSDSAALDGTQQNREPTASAEAKSTLHKVKESPNAYPPLKSVARDLYFILDNCEVWLPSWVPNPLCSRLF